MGWPSVMRSRTSLSFAVAIREQTVAQRTPPPSEPAKRWFLRPSAMAYGQEIETAGKTGSYPIPA